MNNFIRSSYLQNFFGWGIEIIRDKGYWQAPLVYKSVNNKNELADKSEVNSKWMAQVEAQVNKQTYA